MPRRFTVELVAPRVDEVVHTYREVGARFEDSEAGFERTIGVLEDAHARLFERLRGRYVRTGATRASLTQSSASGAIRPVHRDGLQFGTGVRYARWLRKSPKDPESGQIRSAGQGRSAVVIFPRQLQRSVARELLDWMIEPAE